MSTKFAIGCLIQWYECDVIGEYIESLKDALNEYKGEVLVDFTVCANQDLENCINDRQFIKCQTQIKDLLANNGFTATFTDDLITIADYRRTFNAKYCNKVDVLMWGESDSLIPKQTFNILDNLHIASLTSKYPKYLAFFGTCKMWDSSWEPLEHPKFTDKPFKDLDFDNWWSHHYTTTKEEMNRINADVINLDVLQLPQHKFNGCGLVISSEVIKSGVNIPPSVFFTHEDTAFMQVTNKVLGNIPQFVIKNVLLVHNRHHPNKRKYVLGESGANLKEQRLSNNWYNIASKMSEQNCYNLFNPQHKSFTWKDVWDNIK